MEMKSIKKVSILLLVLLHLGMKLQAKVHVHVMNSLGDGKTMTLHCQSKDDDLGTVILEDGQETKWSFSANFFGTTLFYCSVRWENSSSWYSFNAFDADRDYRRCISECRWLVSEGGYLHGLDQESNQWESFPLKRIS